MPAPARVRAGEASFYAPAPTPAQRLAAWLPGTPSDWVAWLCIGVALRLALLPLATHPDMLAVYYRVNMMERGTAALVDHPLQTLPMALHRAWVWLLGLPTPNLDGLPWPAATTREVLENTARALASPAALGWVALWKLPYLLADLACGFVVARVADVQWRRRAFALWMLHPIVLFAGLCLGKYECWMLLPLLLGLHAIQRRRLLRGFLWIGIAVAMRLYPAILLAPLLLAATPSTALRVRLAFLGLLPTATSVACGCTSSPVVRLALIAAAFGAAWLTRRRASWLPLLVGGAFACIAALVVIGPRMLSGIREQDAQLGALSHHGSFFARTGLGSENPILLFVVGYAAVCLWAQRRAVARAATEGPFQDVLGAGMLTALCFCTFSWFNPQYTVLLVPFAVLVAPSVPDGLPAHALQVLGVLLCVLGWREGMTTLHLALPLAPEPLAWTQGHLEVLGASIAGFDIKSVGRTLIAAGSLWMAWDFVRRHARARSLGGAGAWFACAALAWPLLIGGACWIALRGDGLRPLGEPQLLEEGWAATVHPEAIELETGANAPNLLEIQPTKLKELAAIDGLHVTIEPAEGAGEVRELWLPQTEIVDPDRDELVRISLEGADLEPNQRYRIGLLDERRGSVPGAVVQQLAVVPAERLRALLGQSLRSRWEAAGAFAWSWAAVLALLVGAAGFLTWRRWR
ncbi:MAG: hypothetical protein EPO68_07060 [Planctomycetota bacterium]|nr:MAG: hypothetical protein EPO68_07060 [Planctomycetota bacterium]